jgi:hypothetical protein
MDQDKFAEKGLDRDKPFLRKHTAEKGLGRERIWSRKDTA